MRCSAGFKVRHRTAALAEIEALSAFGYLYAFQRKFSIAGEDCT